MQRSVETLSGNPQMSTALKRQAEALAALRDFLELTRNEALARRAKGLNGLPEELEAHKSHLISRVNQTSDRVFELRNPHLPKIK